MNDCDMVQLIREPLEDVHATTALSAVIRQGRALRRRRRLGRWGGAGALATGAALGVTMLSSGGTALAAWTVAVQPHSVMITINQLRDPAGLQRTLRADGVPATVRFNGKMPPSCLLYPGTPSEIFTLTKRIFYSSPPSAQAAYAIDTSAIPANVGLWLTVGPVRSAGQAGGMTTQTFTGSEALVYASGHCP